MSKIDLVIPYVDSSDPNWAKLHEKYININEGESNMPNRYRSLDNLVYSFRSIEKNLSFINNVFLVVSSESQIPWWVNRETVKIVLHEEFIPSQFLPTFNCNTIELFIHKIPGLSEHFIYTNDDLFFLRKIEERECFRGDNVGLAFNTVNNVHNLDMFLHFCRNSWATLKEKSPNSVPLFKIPIHSIHPMRKSSNEKVWDKFSNILEKSISPIRQNKNINQYIFCDYELMRQNTFTPKISFKYTNMGDIYSVAKDIKNRVCDIICINDAPNTKSVFNCKRVINSELFKLFPNPSKYEIRGNSLVSVIMPCYNMSKYVKEAIDSIKGQTYENWECILVDDGSTDNTVDTIEKEIKGDSRFKLIRQKNSGVGSARNTGIRNSNGVYILPLDPDDTIMPTYIAKAADCLDKNSSCALCYGKYKDFGYTNYVQKNVWVNYEELLRHNSIHDSALYRRKDFDNTSGYNTDLKGYEDWEFWIRLLYKNDFVCLINEVMLNYRTKPVSRNTQANSIKGKLIAQIKSLNEEKYKINGNSEILTEDKGASSYTFSSRGVVKKIVYNRKITANQNAIKNFLH